MFVLTSINMFEFIEIKQLELGFHHEQAIVVCRYSELVSSPHCWAGAYISSPRHHLQHDKLIP